LTEHLGYEKGDPAGRAVAITAMASARRPFDHDGEIDISVRAIALGVLNPADPKGQTRFEGLTTRF